MICVGQLRGKANTLRVTIIQPFLIGIQSKAGLVRRFKT